MRTKEEHEEFERALETWRAARIKKGDTNVAEGYARDAADDARKSPDVAEYVERWRVASTANYHAAIEVDIAHARIDFLIRAR
jgi:hypothetical protein